MKNLILFAQIVLMIGCAAADDTAKNLAIAATATPAATATSTGTETAVAAPPSSSTATTTAVPDPANPPAPASNVSPAPKAPPGAAPAKAPDVSVLIAVSVATATVTNTATASATQTLASTDTSAASAIATMPITASQTATATAIATVTATATATQTATQTAVATHTATSTAVLATTANFNCVANFPFMGGGSLYQIYDATGIYQTCTIQNSNNWVTQAASTPYQIGTPTTRANALANVPAGFHLAADGLEVEWAIKDRGEWPCPNNGFIWDTLLLEAHKLMAFAPTMAANPGIFNGFTEQVYAGTLACPLYVQN